MKDGSSLALLTLAFKAFLEIDPIDSTSDGKGESSPGSKGSSQKRSFCKGLIQPGVPTSVACMRPCSQCGPVVQNAVCQTDASRGKKSRKREDLDISSDALVGSLSFLFGSREDLPVGRVATIS